MRYKRLGKTDMKVSVITVGTWAIGGQGWGDVDKKDSIDAIHSMLDEGVNAIDTAPAYGDGYSEEVVGEAIKGKRSDLFITTKFLGDKAPEDGNLESFIHKSCEDSLRRLGTDYIDLYLIHWPNKKLPPKETILALNKLKEQGKIRNIGVSNHNEEQILECEKYGEIGALQPPYSMVNRLYEGLMTWSKHKDIGNMTYGSLGAGILAGAFRTLPSFDPNDMRLRFYDFFEEPKFSKVMELLKKLDVIAQNYNVPVSQVSINWSTQSPIVDTALMGVRNPREAKENCSAMYWQLTKEEIAIINTAISDTVGSLEVREIKVK